MSLNETIKTYDFKTHAVNLGGVLFTGFAEEGITISQTDDTFTEVEGADGTIERVNQGNNRCEITVNILKTNPLNLYLTKLHDADILTNKGMTSFTVKDLTGETYFFVKNAWITKQADIELAKDTSAVSWTLHTGNRTGGVGGKITGSNILG